MNICMMTNTYLPHVGGVARSVSTFAEEYRRLRHRVLVVAPHFDGPPLPARREAIVERVPAIQNFNGSDFSVRLPLAAGLLDRLNAFDAHIIHAHHPFLLGDTALRIGAEKNAPVVFTHHTRYEDYTHYVPFDSSALKDFAITLSTEFANLCDGVIAPSESIEQLIRSRGVTSPIKVVPTGIDLAAFARGRGDRARRKFHLAPDAFVIGHVGRLAPEKNLGFLADAVAQFLAHTPGAVFLVVGGGPSEAQVKERCERAGVGDRLVLAGKLTGRPLYDAYAAMNVFAFASFSETQGMVLAEAMAAGLPVVALDANGVREVVRHEHNGYLLPADASAAVFTQHLARLHRSPKRRDTFARAALETAQLFSRERCARLALDFYGEIRRATRRERLVNELSPWSTLLNRLEVEWNLLASTANAVLEAMRSERETAAP